MSFGSILGGEQGNLAPGSLSTGSPAGRAPLLLKRGGGFNVQSGLRKGKVNKRLRPPSSSAAVR